MVLNFLSKIIFKFPKKQDITLEEYKHLLEIHDWDYSSSNDPIKIEEGKSNHNMLILLASYSEEFRRAFFKAKEKHRPFSGK